MEDDRTLESYGIQQDDVVLIKNKADDLKEKVRSPWDCDPLRVDSSISPSCVSISAR